MNSSSRLIRESIEFLLSDNLCDDYVDFHLIIYKGVERSLLIFIFYFSFCI